MEDPGLIFLTFEELFARIKALENEKIVEVSITYLEIYNETIRDLLIPGGSTKVLHLREDANKQISVAGLSTHTPQSVQHVMEMVLMGNGNRTISPTEANAVSSRSHAVLQVNVCQKARTANISEDHVMATLSIIDLAGSERASVTKNRGDRLLEGANINRSLLALGNCINALCDPHRKCHVPYRDSKLTRLLKFSLGGNCRTVMVVCVSPSSAHYDETHNTLKYGNRAKNIKTKVSRNIVSVDRHVGQYVKIIYDLRQEVEELKKRLEAGGNEDASRLEREQRLQASRYDDALHQLRTAFHQHAETRSRRPQQIAELRLLDSQILGITAWITAFNAVFEVADLQEGLDAFRSSRDQTSAMLRELQYRRDTIEHQLHSCPTLAAIDTVLSTILRNNKGDHNKLLCRAVEAEAQHMKSQITQESLAAEVQASNASLDQIQSTLQRLLAYAFKSTSCLSTDGGKTDEEVAKYNALYSDTYEKGLSLLNGLLAGLPSNTVRSNISRAFTSPARPKSPLKLIQRLASSSSSPRPSPSRSIRVRGSKPHAVFPKKKVVKKSVQWADIDDSLNDSFTGSSPGPAKPKSDLLSKRRSAIANSPPVTKKHKLDLTAHRSLRPIENNTDVDHEDSIISNTDMPIKEYKRPSSAQSSRPFRSTLSALAMSNVTIDMDPRRISRDKENEKSNAPVRTTTSLSNPLRQSLAGMKPIKSGAWR